MESYNMWLFVLWFFTYITFSGLIHVVACVSTSFLFISFHGYTTFCLPIHLLMDTWIASTLWLLWRVLIWTLVYQFLIEYLFLILLGIYQGVVFLGHLLIPCWTFWGTSKQFSIAAETFYIPTNNVQGFQFLHILANTCYFPLEKLLLQS